MSPRAASLRYLLLATLCLGNAARADRDTQRKVDVTKAPACRCSTACTDSGDESWCFTDSACSVATHGWRGHWRYCAPKVESERIAKSEESKNCNEGKWAAFRDEQLAALAKGQSSPQVVVQNVEACRHNKIFQTGKKALTDHYEPCVKKLDAYFKVLTRPGLGLDKDNEAYFKAYKDKELKVPAKLADKDLFELLHQVNLSDSKSVAAVVKRIHELYSDAIVLPYVSPGTLSIDQPNTYGRIVVWVNDSGLSRYVQFTANANPSDKPVHRFQASIVNVESGKGAFIYDWTRSDAKDHRFDNESGKGQNNQRCYQCHASGVLAIHPFEHALAPLATEVAGSLGKDYEKWLAELNKTYAASATRLNEQIEKDYTPKTGMVDAPDRTLHGGFASDPVPDAMKWPEASEACTSAQHEAVKAIKTDKTCVACHLSRGSTIMSEEVAMELMNKYVGLGYMPPANKGDKDARAKAAKCFIESASYYNPKSALAKWLATTTCQ